MSEGYGLSLKAIDEFESGLLITVDNGIVANDAIQKAKDKGLTVIILDHHLPQKVLPCADIIVDPHVNPKDNGFTEYCGAGLAYKLAQLLVPDDEEFLQQMEAFAGIGTIADSMLLIGDNRKIVKNALKTMNLGKNIAPGLKALLSVADVYDINETDVGFKIGPMLNAAGRMKDDGAMIALNTLIASDYNLGIIAAQELQRMNEERKEMTSSTESYVNDIIQEECLFNDKPLCLFVEGIPEGIVGIIVGRIAEKYKVPSIILTDTEKEGFYKGSARSYGDYNLMTVIDAARSVLYKAGGHAGAAGLSVTADNYSNMVKLMQKAMIDYQTPEINTIEYDLEIKSSEVEKIYSEVQKYAPYGQGNPQPVFMIKDVILSPRAGSTSKYMGKNYEHVKLFAKDFSIAYFNKAQDFKNLGCPFHIDVVGNLSLNVFRKTSELQLEAIDLCEHKNLNDDKPNSLMAALRLNGTI
jgi:single-stranded-DNA-specific exonuclease